MLQIRQSRVVLTAMMLFLLAGGVAAQARRPNGNTRADEDSKPPVSNTDPGRPPRVAPVVTPPAEHHPPVPVTPGPVHRPPAHHVQPPPVHEPQRVSVPEMPMIEIYPVNPGTDADYGRETVPSEVPVPLGVCLRDRLARPDQGGYNFALDRVVYWDDEGVEIWYEVIGTKGFLMTPGEIRIVRIGSCASVNDIGYIPPMSSSARRIVALPGNGYAVQMSDGSLVRLRVVAATDKEVVFEWLP